MTDNLKSTKFHAFHYKHFKKLDVVVADSHPQLIMLSTPDLYLNILSIQGWERRTFLQNPTFKKKTFLFPRIPLLMFGNLFSEKLSLFSVF